MENLLDYLELFCMDIFTVQNLVGYLVILVFGIDIRGTFSLEMSAVQLRSELNVHWKLVKYI